MNRLLKIISLPLLLLVLMVSGLNAGNLRTGLITGFTDSKRDDSTSLIRYIIVDSFQLNIVPPSAGLQFYKDGIIFLANSKDERRMSSKHISFGAKEAYYAPVLDSVPGRHSLFSRYSPFSYPCEAMTFSHDYTTIYYTKFPMNGNKEKIFMAKVTLNESNRRSLVTENTPLNICSGNSVYSHPALSSDDNTMVFASDKQGTLGGMDLFVSRKTGEKWSEPENLGKSINTKGNEFYPFLDMDNNLFFSSDGLPGHGGFDIFTCKFNGTGWDNPVNLSGSINSDQDDIAFTINKLDGKTAFFTRRQKSGRMNTQLFRVTLMSGIKADQNILTISYVFNGSSVPDKGLTAIKTESEVKQVKEPVATETGSLKEGKSKNPDMTLALKKQMEKITINKPPTGKRPSRSKVVKIKPAIPTTAAQKDVVIYRIQILTTARPKNEKEIILSGKSYKLFEYVYNGAYRYTVGEFTVLQQAIELQRTCRQSGYPQSFVVAFKNNTRSLDPNLFK
jgi:hypothetical protein